jgi:hypothetical protein
MHDILTLEVYLGMKMEVAHNGAKTMAHSLQLTATDSRPLYSDPIVSPALIGVCMLS